MLPAHDRDHDGHREEPQSFGGHGIESIAKSRTDQRSHAPARSAPGQAIELSDELGSTQPGDAAHLYYRVTPAGIYPSFFRGDCSLRCTCGAAHGYHVVISCFEEDPEVEASEADSLLARRVDGLIIASSQPKRCLAMFERVQEQRVPYVLIDRPIAGLRRLLCRSGQPRHRPVSDRASNRTRMLPNRPPARSGHGNCGGPPGRIPASVGDPRLSSGSAVCRCWRTSETIRVMRECGNCSTSTRFRMACFATTIRSQSGP